MLTGIHHAACRALARSYFTLLCALLVTGHTRAAYISEIDLGTSVAGQGIEFSQFGSATEHTLLIMEAGPTSNDFGRVYEVIHLPASIGLADVAMVTDSPWPDNTAHTTTLDSLDKAVSTTTTLPLNNSRLLVLMEGRSTLGFFTNPVSDSAATATYNQTTVTDWLVLTNGDQKAQYQASQDITAINTALSINLLNRIVDKDAGQVIARAILPDAHPEDPIDLDTLYAGTPDATSRQFDLPDDGYVYTYTPSMTNLPLSHMPEPNTLALFALAGTFVLRRSRQALAR